MQRIYFTAKSHVNHFQLYYCCWFAPVRVGLFIIGYFNIMIDLVYIVGIANGGIKPTVMAVQDALFTDYVSSVAPIIAYVIELAFNVVLLCALYRKDVVLLRVFLYYTCLAVVMSFLTYSMVLAAVPAYITIAIIISTIFQIYCILLVRSGMVDMKMEGKKYELPRLELSSLPEKRTYDYSQNGHKVTITELPKPQEVRISMIDQDDRIKDTKDIEAKKDMKYTKIKKDLIDTDIKKDIKVMSIKKDIKDDEIKNESNTAIAKDAKKVELKKDVKVIVDIESTKKKEDEISKDVKTKEEIKKEERKIKEAKIKEEKRIREEKKKEERRLKEEKKKEGKKSKEESKKEEKDSNKDEKLDSENSEQITESNKELKEKWLQTVIENPKE